MKRLQSKLWVKCTAVALLVVFGLLLAASALGIAYLAVNQAYDDGGDAMRQQLAEDVMYQTIQSEAWSALTAYKRGQQENLKLIQEKYTADKSNLYFAWVNEQTGEPVLQIGEADATPFASSHYSMHQSFTYYSDADDDIVYALHVYLRDPLSAHDRVYTVLQRGQWLISMRVWLIVLAVVFLAVCVFLFIFLLCAMGRKEGVDGIYLYWFNRVPLDLAIFLLIALGGCWVGLLADMISLWDFWWYLLAGAGIAALLLLFILSFAGRVKAPGLFKNSLIYIVFAWIFRALARIPMVWRTMLIWGAWCIVDLYLSFGQSYSRSSLLPVLWMLSRCVLTIVILYLASSLKLLQKQGQAIAEGKTDYKGKPIPGWLPALKTHEKNLQSIQAGIGKAVDEQLRAERMKTELITNVSHDIKTPLTSIVNYVDLLSKEDIQPEKAKEYVVVLGRQSARLKKLTEDLVEASKASSGSMAVHLAATDVNVLLSQMAGEYVERLEAAQLEPVFKPDPAQPKIQADGKLLSRVLGNLFSNICKYAMPGTRVYFESAVENGVVAMRFKNISRYELDIPAEELMARFVRGDRSRHTEGSGLGLSIAQSLTELQGGTFRVAVDGDLFKAELIFTEYKG